MLVLNGTVSRAWDHSDPQPGTFFLRTDLLGFAKGFQRRAERGEVEEDLTAIVQGRPSRKWCFPSFLHASLELAQAALFLSEFRPLSLAWSLVGQ